MGNLTQNQPDHWLSKLPFDKWNYGLFLIGLLVVILGFVIMARGDLESTQSLTVAPIVLLVGYLVIIPIAIMFQKKSKQSDDHTGS